MTWLIGSPVTCLHRLQRERRPAELVGRVDLVHAVARDLDLEVARQRHDRRGLLVRVEPDEHDRVRARSRRHPRCCPSAACRSPGSSASAACPGRVVASLPLPSLSSGPSLSASTTLSTSWNAATAVAAADGEHARAPPPAGGASRVRGGGCPRASGDSQRALVLAQPGREQVDELDQRPADIPRATGPTPTPRARGGRRRSGRTRPPGTPASRNEIASEAPSRPTESCSPSGGGATRAIASPSACT